MELRSCQGQQMYYGEWAVSRSAIWPDSPGTAVGVNTAVEFFGSQTPMAQPIRLPDCLVESKLIDELIPQLSKKVWWIGVCSRCCFDARMLQHEKFELRLLRLLPEKPRVYTVTSHGSHIRSRGHTDWGLTWSKLIKIKVTHRRCQRWYWIDKDSFCWKPLFTAF